MRLVLQRVSAANLTVEGEEPRAIGPGLVALVGICPGDDAKTADWMAKKTLGLRVFTDGAGKLNLSVLETGGELLVVSNFTLYADCKKGRRPAFTGAAGPELAQPLYERFAAALREGGGRVTTGTFGGAMEVDIHNSGPITILLDSEEIMPKKERSQQ